MSVISMRHLLGAGAKTMLCALALLAAGSVRAQDFPTRTITIVVPFPPGGSTDLLARQIADRISGPLKQPVIVENRPGAGGTVGANSVAKAAPDGYTLLMGVTGTNAISPALRDDLPYDPVKDLVPVTMVVTAPLAIVVKADSPIKNVKDFIAATKAKPNTITHGTPGVGTSMHLAAELFGLESGTKLVHVPYKGSAGAVQDLLGGQLDAMFGDVLVTVEYIKAGKLRALAVTSKERHFMLPDVPTLAESGLPGFEALSWQALFAPAGTPQPILTKLHAEVSKALRSEDLKKYFADRGFVVDDRSPQASKEYIEAEVKKWKRVVDAAGLKTK